MSKRRKQRNRSTRPEGSPHEADRGRDAAGRGLHFMNFEVTWETMVDPLIEALPPATRDRMDAIFQVIYERPAEIVGELRVLTERHPDIPCLKNWLISALRGSSLQAERAEAADRAARLFRDFPDYFFARTTLADIQLSEGKLDQAAELLLGPGKALDELYPGRKMFHISEIRHWAYVCCRILIAQGKAGSARAYRDLLSQMEPGSTIVRSLDGLLEGNAGTFARLFSRLRNEAEPRHRGTRARGAGGRKGESPAGLEQPELF